MNKTIFFGISLLLIFSSCGKNSDSQTNENDLDSLSTSTEQNLGTDAEVKKITFEIFADSGTVELAKGEEGSPVASFKEQILVVTQVPSQTNLEAIQAILQKQQEYLGDAKEALAKKKKEYFDGYKEAYSEAEEGMGMSANWERNVTANVLYNDNYFTTIAFYSDEYGGGAHSYYVESYLVLDLKTSKQLLLNDIFDTNGITKLTKKLTEKALEMAKKEGYSSLSEYGFSVEEVAPTEKFIVTEEGIEFTYNRSEITPHAIPPPAFFLTWNELNDVIKTDSPLRALMK